MSESLRNKIVLWMVWVQSVRLPVIYLMLLGTVALLSLTAFVGCSRRIAMSRSSQPIEYKMILTDNSNGCNITCLLQPLKFD